MKSYCENYNGIKAWYKDLKKYILHRLDGPALEWANGDKEWWVNGKLHRIGGPAIECINGSNEWWILGIRYSESDYNRLMKLGVFL